MRAKFTALAVLTIATSAATTLAVAPSASAATSPSAYTSRLITLVNQARAQHGVRALSVAGGTTTVAAGWSAHMASSSTLAHNPDLQSQLESHGSPNWTTYGENVGEGSASNADQLFTAYMNSPEHRANILDSSYRYLGIATSFSGGLAWNTMDFVDQYGGSATAPAAARTATVRHTTASRPAVRPATAAAPAAAKPAAAHHVATRAAARHATARHTAHKVAPAQHLRSAAHVSGVHPRTDVLLTDSAAFGTTGVPASRLLPTMLAGLALALAGAAWAVRRRQGAVPVAA